MPDILLMSVWMTGLRLLVQNFVSIAIKYASPATTHSGGNPDNGYCGCRRTAPSPRGRGLGRGERSLMSRNSNFSIDCCPHPNPSPRETGTARAATSIACEARERGLSAELQTAPCMYKSTIQSANKHDLQHRSRYLATRHGCLGGR